MKTRISLFFAALALVVSLPAWSQARNVGLFNGEREWIHEYGYTLGAVLGSYTGTPMAYHLNQSIVYTPRLIFPFKNAGSLDVVPNVGLGLTSSLLLGRSNLIASELGCMVHLNSGLGSSLDNASTFGAFYGLGLQSYTIHVLIFSTRACLLTNHSPTWARPWTAASVSSSMAHPSRFRFSTAPACTFPPPLAELACPVTLPDGCCTGCIERCLGSVVRRFSLVAFSVASLPLLV